MKPGAWRFLRALALVPALSCGPEAEERLDRDAIVEAYCEKLDGCGGELDYVTKEDCLAGFELEGVDDGATYDDLGCLQEELRFVLCVTDVPCDDVISAGNTEDDPCWEESSAVIEAGCLPLR